MKRFYLFIPEFYLFVVILLVAYSPPFHWNPTFLVLALLVVVQFFLRNRVYGMLIASVFFLINILFLGAVISEFNDFVSMNTSAFQLILVGSIIFLLNLLMSVTMFFKYFRMSRIKKLEDMEPLH